MKKGFLYNSVKTPFHKRNAFDMSHTVLTTCEMGKLIPVLCTEIVPGDTVSLNTAFYMRMMPTISPIMHNISVYFRTFFVPTRLIWENFEEFISWSESDVSERPVVPYVTPQSLKAEAMRLGGSDDTINSIIQNYFGTNSLWDYFNLPTFNGVFTSGSSASTWSTERIVSLPFRAYQLIWNEYFRDENLQDEFNHSISDGPEPVALGTNPNYLRELFTLRNVAWQKDYFTSALPWLQKGDPVELLPNQTYSATTELKARQNRADLYLYKYDGSAWNNVDGENLGVKPMSASDAGLKMGQLRSRSNSNDFVNGGTDVQFDPNDITDNITATTNVQSLGSGITINSLRRAARLQEWKEIFARAGSRFKEVILGHFNVLSRDARLQRPEYLGGYSTPVLMQEVLQTSASQEGTLPSAQGNPAGKGFTSSVSPGRIKKNFTEHGYLITLMYVRPQSMYTQGIPRMFSRFDNTEYYWPLFANLGEQEIRNKELYFNISTMQEPGFEPNGIFGYTPRYAEYKDMTDKVNGDFRTTLYFWHLGRFFGGLGNNEPADNPESTHPKLNEDFILCKPRTDIYAVETSEYGNHLLFQIRHNLKMFRLMPKFGTPRL